MDCEVDVIYYLKLFETNTPVKRKLTIDRVKEYIYTLYFCNFTKYKKIETEIQGKVNLPTSQILYYLQLFPMKRYSRQVCLNHVCQRTSRDWN